MRWFLSREGEFLHESFRRSGGDSTESCVLWASRNICIEQMLVEWRAGKLDASLFGPLKARDMATVIRLLGAGFALDCSKSETFEQFLDRKSRRAEDWLNASLGTASLKEKRHDKWRRYLIEKVGDNREIIIYDVGWHGTMQYCLQALIAAHFPQREIHVRGIYLGTFRSSLPITFCGLVCENESPGNRFKDLKLCVEIVEILLASPHGTVEGVDFEAGQWVPVRAADHELGDGLERVLRYRERLSAVFQDIYFGSCSAEAVNQLVRLLRAPSAEELRLFGDLAYRTNEGSDRTPAYLARPKGVWGYLLFPWMLLRDYKSAFWRLGFYRRLSWPCRVMLRLMMPRLRFSRE